MSISSTNISQKDYLKKYLSGDVKKKKKKAAKGNSAVKRSTIIDDDIDLKSMRPLDDDEVDLLQLGEDAPQIAGIIDERPEEVKAQEKYNSKRWKVFGGEDGLNVVDNLNGEQQNKLKSQDEDNKLTHQEESKRELPKSVDSNNLLERSKCKKITHKNNLSPIRVNKEVKEDSDPSPPRKSLHNDSDTSPPRKNSKQSKVQHDVLYSRRDRERRKYQSDSDPSPPRNITKVSKTCHEVLSSRRGGERRKYRSDSDKSPSMKSSKQRELDRDLSSQRNKHRNKHSSDSDASPHRKSTKQSKRDRSFTPPRKDRQRTKYSSTESDTSPPRKSAKQNKIKMGSSPLRKDRKIKMYISDSDSVPSRKTLKLNQIHSDSHRLKKDTEKITQYNDSDTSPPRKNSKVRDSKITKFTTDSDNRREKLTASSSKSDHHSSKRKQNRYTQNSDSDNSSPMKKQDKSFNDEGSSDLSPPRNESKLTKKKLYIPNDDSSSDGTQTSRNKKMKTTLDGRVAGLQDATQLRKELSDLKMKEDLVFSKMDASVSGVGAQAIKRDRKTGQIRDFNKEKEIQKEKDAKASVLNEKYSKWGRGLKQVDDDQKRTADMMKVMSKPLARYANDEDLDNFLKAQERDGDPMLDFIKKKQKESTSLDGEKPIYKGPYNPNRFRIRPGYRWDGVVRSNGYEKDWFSHQNARKAREKEAHAWSTSDM